MTKNTPHACCVSPTNCSTPHHAATTTASAIDASSIASTSIMVRHHLRLAHKRQVHAGVSSGGNSRPDISLNDRRDCLASPFASSDASAFLGAHNDEIIGHSR